MKKSTFAFVLMLVLFTFTTNKLQATTLRQAPQSLSEYFYTMVDDIKRVANEEWLPRFEKDWAWGCDLIQSSLAIETIQTNEVAEKITVTQVETKTTDLAPKNQVMTKPAEKMGVSEIMWLIQEVGAGAMY